MTIKNFISRSAVLTSVVAGAIIVTGCGNNEGASLRVIDTSPDVPAVNASLDGDAAITDLDYAAGSGFSGVKTGATDITLEAIIPGSNQDVIPVPDFPLDKNERYTIIAVNETAIIEGVNATVIARQPNDPDALPDDEPTGFGIVLFTN